MKRGSLVAAAVVVLVANGFALLHAWRNRSGPVESDITLTQRELLKSYDKMDEDSGVALNLQWIDKQGWSSPSPWLDQKILQEVGFDTRVAPSDKAASDFYARQRARRAFVALEYDGPNWSKWIDQFEQQAQAASRIYTPPGNQRETSTRLVAIDASGDVARLRARHPDRSSVIIVPAVIDIRVEPAAAKNPGRLYGSIQEIPSSIHLPLPFSDGFRRMSRDRNSAKYRVHLRYGAFLEPWIIAVEIPTP
jgi:Domain of unknown function (DUF4824)